MSDDCDVNILVAIVLAIIRYSHTTIVYIARLVRKNDQKILDFFFVIFHGSERQTMDEKLVAVVETVHRQWNSLVIQDEKKLQI